MYYLYARPLEDITNRFNQKYLLSYLWVVRSKEDQTNINIKKLKMLYFSPTGTTKKIVKTIASAIQYEKLESIDFTKKNIRENANTDLADSDLVVIGTPVYYGRIPSEVSDYFSKIHANNVYAILVVVYGNREYEDSLKEFYDATCAAGFMPIACAAFIGEHSYSSEKLPMAHGRPDKMDLEKAKSFGSTIQRELEYLISHDNTVITMPGNSDYKNKTMPKYPIAPDTVIEQCTICKICLGVCPVEAITIDNQSNIKTDVNLCILCFACVKNCPSGARGINDAFWVRAIELLHKKCLERKEPEVYLIGD